MKIDLVQQNHKGIRFFPHIIEQASKPCQAEKVSF